MGRRRKDKPVRLRQLVLLMWWCLLWWCCSCAAEKDTAAVFQETVLNETNTKVVECRATKVQRMNITGTVGNVSKTLITVQSSTKQCFTFHDFASCTFGPSSVTAKVLVNDLREGDSRKYTCTVIQVGTTYDPKHSYPLIVHGAVPSTEGPQTATTNTGPEKKESANAGTTNGSEGFSSAAAAVVIVLLVVAIVISGVLGYKVFKEWRQKQGPTSMDADANSEWSGVTDKDFCYSTRTAQGGAGGGRGGGSEGMAKETGPAVMGVSTVSPLYRDMISPLSSPPPTVAAPETPGHYPVVMHYQLPCHAATPAATAAASLTLKRRGVDYVNEPPEYSEAWGNTLPCMLTQNHTASRGVPGLVKIPNPGVVDACYSSTPCLGVNSGLSAQEIAPLSLEENNK